MCGKPALVAVCDRLIDEHLGTPHFPVCGIEGGGVVVRAHGPSGVVAVELDLQPFLDLDDAGVLTDLSEGTPPDHESPAVRVRVADRLRHPQGLLDEVERFLFTSTEL